MQVIQLRDNNGFLKKEGAAVAYIYCPETDGLRAIEKCEKCEFHVSRDTEVVKCNNAKECNPPYYYNR